MLSANRIDPFPGQPHQIRIWPKNSCDIRPDQAQVRWRQRSAEGTLAGVTADQVHWSPLGGVLNLAIIMLAVSDLTFA